MTTYFFKYSFKRWGIKSPGDAQLYHVYYEDKLVATAMRTGNKYGSWWVLPVEWSKGVSGFRSKNAVTEFLMDFYMDDPWHGDPSTQGYSEYSIDGNNWTRERPEGPCKMRYVGVSLSIDIGRKNADVSSSSV